MNDIPDLIESYSRGPDLLRAVVQRTPESGWDAKPIEGKWSIREVVCHLADSEIVYADRIKRVLTENEPTMFDADPNVLVPSLFVSNRTGEIELKVIQTIRAHMMPILLACPIDSFQRTGIHSTEGRMSLETLLRRITEHIPHHVSFIEEKLRAL